MSQPIFSQTNQQKPETIKNRVRCRLGISSSKKTTNKGVRNQLKDRILIKQMISSDSLEIPSGYTNECPPKKGNANVRYADCGRLN